ncbi:MAG TPA: ABC-2 family transporter protein [Aggregatilinea sp.]|uniref:ABC transporter permease n=1 Tax=Aggregatilinea sp. TaxID=2806333 RepID=UPI002C246650|nr:ABC-2 family transporter protein [Aggregatilinea sp.]HML23813.1 ABC-2 family transporter protein [Aggregatilinea sp.]
MRHYIRLVWKFLRASVQQEIAYPVNFVISLAYGLINLAGGVIGIEVLFGQVDDVRGWTFASTLAILGVYMTIGALRGLFISPSLDALAGMDGDVWTGRLDYVMLRPVDIQFLASVRQWRPFALIDLALGLGVLVAAVTQLDATLSAGRIAAFLALLALGMLVMYSVLLAFAGMIFWSPGFLFGWVFNGLFQMARYPVSLYPGGVRLVLTWIVPVGVMTTIPAQALTGDLALETALGSLVLAVALFAGATALFRTGVRRYASASS